MVATIEEKALDNVQVSHWTQHDLVGSIHHLIFVKLHPSMCLRIKSLRIRMGYHQQGSNIGLIVAE